MTAQTLDFVIKTLEKIPDFNNFEPKNWEAVAGLAQGVTATQCARRYKELLEMGGKKATHQSAHSLRPETSSKDDIISLTESEYMADSLTNRDNVDMSRKDKKLNSKSVRDKHDHSDRGPIMVIHVCDETKNVKKDFQCPRDMLVQEMKYFAEYLSNDTHRWEEVDISVHCNVQIFEWLMQYVKWKTKLENEEEPKLEANNVISILISSEFLKMDSLVTECINFCHKNMNTILATPCNMGCINDKILSRLSNLFSHCEADNLKDRKDKFKSKLFCKKLEKLFDADVESPDFSEKATDLFRCSVCQKCLTHKMKKKIRCLPSRMILDKDGSLIYCHAPDPNFDVNQFVLDVRSRCKTWRDVYWYIWGLVNQLNCDRCGHCFQLTDFSCCSYHPDQPRYENEPGGISSYVGVYPCCRQVAVRFDPFHVIQGCESKDHLVKLNGKGHNAMRMRAQQLYECLLERKDIICALNHSHLVDNNTSNVNIFSNETLVSKSHTSDKSQLSSLNEESRHTSRPKGNILNTDTEVLHGSEELRTISDLEAEEFLSPPGVLTAKKMTKDLSRFSEILEPGRITVDARCFEQTKRSTWDTQKSLRYNQDAQRQEDARRIKEIRCFLAKLRLTAEKVDRPKKELAGGIYSLLDYQWKVSNCLPAKQQTQVQPRARVKPLAVTKSS